MVAAAGICRTAHSYPERATPAIRHERSTRVGGSTGQRTRRTRSARSTIRERAVVLTLRIRPIQG